MKIKDERIKTKGVYKLLELTSWYDFTDFIDKNWDIIKNCLFRGQCDPTWELKPSIYRDIPKETKRDTIDKIFKKQLENFKNYTRGRHNILYNDFISSCEEVEDEHWWALGQHYGLKTPLLDWVRTPYVAAYFSFNEESKSEMRSIYILDLDEIENILIKSNSIGMYSIRKVDRLMHENDRLISQQGLFTFITLNNDDKSYFSIEYYLVKLVGLLKEKITDEIFLLKINISALEKELALERLNSMNINDLTLFPDLKGSAVYCNYLLGKDFFP